MNSVFAWFAVFTKDSIYISPLLSISWFHGKISGPEAVCKLQPAEDGLFLVRESIRHPGDYVLCVSVSGEVMHYRVIYQDHKLTIDNSQYFYNLIDMIEVIVVTELTALLRGQNPAACITLSFLWIYIREFWHSFAYSLSAWRNNCFSRSIRKNRSVDVFIQNSTRNGHKQIIIQFN